MRLFRVVVLAMLVAVATSIKTERHPRVLKGKKGNKLSKKDEKKKKNDKKKKGKKGKKTPAQKLAELLNLQPHPEGGFFRETFRSTQQIVTVNNDGELGSEMRDASTAIYYLFDETAVSKFHRLDDDEVWHFYQGDCEVVIHMLHPDGSYSNVELGSIDSGVEPQAVVLRNTWFGVERTSPCSYALMGTTVAPGFEFSHWELAERDELLQQYPDHQDVIVRLT